MVTELRFLTQLLFSYFLFTLGPLGHHYSSPRNNYIRGGRMGVTAVASLCCVLLFRTFTQTKRSAAMKTITYPDFDNVGIIFCMVIWFSLIWCILNDFILSSLLLFSRRNLSIIYFLMHWIMSLIFFNLVPAVNYSQVVYSWVRFINFGPRVYPKGSLVIALVRPCVCPCVYPSLNISETAY